MAHPMWALPRTALAAHIRRTDAALWQGLAAVVELPPGVGEYVADMKDPERACSTLSKEMTVPLCHGGLGLLIQPDKVGAVQS